MKRTFAACALLSSFGDGACSPSPRDVVPESRDVRAAATESTPADAYAYVAQRPHGTIALAEARHIPDADAHAIVDRLADELERCATQLEASNALVAGAVRVVAVAGPDGTPALNVRLAPGDAVAQNALLCIVAPVRATALPRPEGERRPGMAIEATWGPRGRGASRGPAADASAPL